jgi:glycosyltransferase involved in cell wall biosynthesis
MDTEPRARPKVAIVHDYLTQRGGAERVVLSFCRIFPDAPVYTSLYDPDGTFPEFSDIDVRSSWLNRFAPLRADHRRAFPLLAPAFSSMRIDADVVLCSSSGWAHGAHVTGRKIVYCHAPARWLYQTDRYVYGSIEEIGEHNNGSLVANGKAPHLAEYLALQALAPPLRRWDCRAARTADLYLTNSSAVKDNISVAYGIEANVISPPSTFTVQGARTQPMGVKPGFILCVSRLLPYKNVHAAVAGVAPTGQGLVIVGDGPELSKLKRDASTNTTFLGSVDDATLRWLYENCSALVAISYEDYGLTPIEAACFGKPTLALRRGGYLDTVLEGITGVFVDSPTSASVTAGLRTLQNTNFDNEAIRDHGESYTYAGFSANIRAAVEGATFGTRDQI